MRLARPAIRLNVAFRLHPTSSATGMRSAPFVCFASHASYLAVSASSLDRHDARGILVPARERTEWQESGRVAAREVRSDKNRREWQALGFGVARIGADGNGIVGFRAIRPDSCQITAARVPSAPILATLRPTRCHPRRFLSDCDPARPARDIPPYSRFVVECGVRSGRISIRVLTHGLACTLHPGSRLGYGRIVRRQLTRGVKRERVASS